MEILNLIFVYIALIYFVGPINCQKQESNDATFFLYTRTNPLEPLTLNQDSTPLNSQLPLKMIIHGFTESADVQWYKDMIQAYLRKEDCSVIAVDWSKRAQSPYAEAVFAVRPVGTSIGTFLVRLGAENRIQLTITHIVGHSLGAHVAGFAGKQVYRLTRDTKVARITGLDPAGPLFEAPLARPRSDRLSNGDADFVDVIHTDGGVFGYRASIGDADFFPNGGVALQPGCPIPRIDNLLEVLCSHQRSHQYFIESVNSEGFVAQPCSSWNDYERGLCNENEDVLFGENATPNSTGNFYLRTNSQSPYALN